MNKCGNCGEESLADDTDIVVVRGLRKQLVWVEFCEPCGDKWVITTVNGKTYTAKDLLEAAKERGTAVTKSDDEVDQLQRQLYGKAQHEPTPFN